MKIEIIYRKGNRDINEDSFVINKEDQIFAVIDGATGVGGLSGDIASGIIREALETENGDITERILKGNATLGKKTVETLGESTMENTPKYKRSSCGLAAIQLPLSGMKMEYAAAADCLFFLQYKNNEIRQINHDLVDPLDRAVIELVQKQWKRYISGNDDPNEWEPSKIKQTLQEIRETILDILQANRNKMNNPEGYNIIDGSKTAEEFLESGVIPLINVKKILLLTDGLKIHSHRLEPIENEWLYSAKIAFEHGLSYLEKTILDMEINDPACYQYPRLKQHDDKTGILIHL
ncbi:MAG TPA: hypothetical protein VJ546_05570 [Bacillales bacterium]|nr:hypothetical protein [Bacillales bacterium]